MVRKMEISTIIAIISCVIAVSSFVLNRKDKSNENVEDASYRQGVLDQQLKNIFEKLEKIERKLDTYDAELDERINKAIEFHVQKYHE